MKIRHGFVSNSSSSSFVIALAEKPKTVREVETLLFDANQVAYTAPYSDECFALATVASVVLQDLEKAEPLTFEQLVDELSSGWLFYDQVKAEIPDVPYDADMDDRRVVWQKQTERTTELATVMANEFFQKHEGKLWFRLEYSDNDGAMYSAMEHGDLFHNVPHAKISHH